MKKKKKRERDLQKVANVVYICKKMVRIVLFWANLYTIFATFCRSIM